MNRQITEAFYILAAIFLATVTFMVVLSLLAIGFLTILLYFSGGFAL